MTTDLDIDAAHELALELNEILTFERDEIVQKHQRDLPEVQWNDTAPWRVHYLRGVMVAGVNHAEVLGSAHYDGRTGVWIRYANFGQPAFISEHHLRHGKYVAA